MTREETLKVMSVLRVAYPGYYRQLGREDAQGAVALWQSMFEDEPYDLVCAAVRAHIAADVRGFPPHIGAIKESIGKVLRPDELTEQEAWRRVRESCKYYDAPEKFEALSPLLRKLVGSPAQLREWAMMEADELDTVVASNFQRSYRAAARRERELLALPSSVRELLEGLSGALRLDGAGRQ